VVDPVRTNFKVLLKVEARLENPTMARKKIIYHTYLPTLQLNVNYLEISINVYMESSLDPVRNKKKFAFSTPDPMFFKTPNDNAHTIY